VLCSSTKVSNCQHLRKGIVLKKLNENFFGPENQRSCVLYSVVMGEGQYKKASSKKKWVPFGLSAGLRLAIK